MACITTKPISKMCIISLLPSSSSFTSTKVSYPPYSSSKPTPTILSLSFSLIRKTHFSKMAVHVSDFSHQDDSTSVTATVSADPEEEPVFTWGEDTVADVEERESEEDTYVDPPEEAKLFVGNLPYDVDSGTLAQLFGQAGVVEISEIIYNRETDQSRGFGFVTMSTVEQAEKAVEMLHQYDMNGRFLTVNKASPRGARPERTPRLFEPSYRLYVGNLPWDVDDSRLEQVFSEHGKVVNARVVYDRETGRSRGFGFITMESESELNDAISNLDGQDLGGRAIKVNVAEERARRPY